MPGPAPGFRKRPGYEIRFEPSPKRVRVQFGGATVADSTRVRLLFETKHLPVYYFPVEDVDESVLTLTDHRTHCPFKGEASHWTVRAGGREAENAVWGYDSPYDETSEIAGYRAFYWDRMDHWFEEDEEVFVHARDPYTRIDILQSHRRVEIVLGGKVVADSANALFLFETGLPARYYLPREDVRMDLLTPTGTRTRCPYKGEAVYWTAEAGGQTFDDIVWAYPDPVAEAARIADRLCFFNERVDAVRIDGEEQDRPKTKWSGE